jgi:shikimate kinase
VKAARDAGVTVTGAFDDASASMLGGLTVTDNGQDSVLHRDDPLWDVAVWTPPERAFSADADVERCRAVAPMADLAADLALGGQYGRAMTVNGLAFSAALGFPTEPAVAAMPHVSGVSLSGTGPSVVAVGSSEGVEIVAERWAERDGETWTTTTETDGGRQE